ncbi:hypothetical protein CIB48_g2512 [Xylaria polymorpha]|nr:hypothetical protein CIB48_g2512 [Xylaria polymorpha]
MMKSRQQTQHRDRDRKRSAEVDHERDHDGKSTSSRHHHRHRHHHRRHKRRRTRSKSPTPQNPYDPPPLDAEAAFRESLFDAMADDEAPRTGRLERMGDDEYAAYVRQKMWEKTHQGLLEERARREEQRKRKEHEAEEAARLTKEMERSLRRDLGRPGTVLWGGMAWPVRSGRREDIEASSVRDFYVMGIDPVDVGETEFLARLKDERVRWHPDKIQQRLGGRVDEAVMRGVTAVFQIVDKLWNDTRSKQTARAQ